MTKVLLVAVLLAVPAVSQPQTTTTGPAQTKGTCSPANTGNRNTFTINCGIGEAQGKEMIQILNKILASQEDPSAVMSKLDEILKEINPNRPQITYTMDGHERINSPSTFDLEPGANSIFKQLLELQKKGDWAAVLRLSKEQMEVTPDWLTAYAFAAVADAYLGNLSEARRLATYAKQRIAGNPDYRDLDPTLNNLLALPTN